MAASSLKKGWLTSLISPTPAQAPTTSCFINDRSVKYLKDPQFSFRREIQNNESKIVDDVSIAVGKRRAVIGSSAVTSRADSNTALSELTKTISTLSLKNSCEDDVPKVTAERHSLGISPSTAQGQDTASSDLHTHPQACHGPIHFHRRAHKNVHNHSILSNPSPVTSERRRYAIPKSHAHNLQPLTFGQDEKALSRPSTPEPISPTTIKNHLQNLFDDKEWDANCAERERRNPFPHLDQNVGWNRAFCSVKMYFSTEWTPYDNDGTLKGALEEMTYIKRSFARFSLWAQREAMEFDDEDLRGENGWAKVFDMVFRGEGVGLCWARVPGSWRAVKPGLLTCCRTVAFYDEALDWTESIRERVRDWRAQNPGWRTRQASSAKRRFNTLWPGCQDNERFERTWLSWKEPLQHGNTQFGVKRTRLRRPEPEKIATEKWRARRREQEKKAGRWLDGTSRQDRMWAEFHWVLNFDDPREHVWPRCYRYYYRNGVRYWYRI